MQPYGSESDKNTANPCMQLVDVHCHLESDALLPRLDMLLDAARVAGVRKCITASAHPTQWEISASLAHRYEQVDYAVGVHPWYCDDKALMELARLQHAAHNAVAIGEIGLDKKTERVPLTQQMVFFTRQLRVAQQMALPVVLHCRGAFNEMLSVFKTQGPPPGGIVHNFSGSPELANQFMNYGLAFSMGGVLTWRNSAKRRRLLRHIFPDHFLLETDAPDIPPVEARSQTNTPANMLYNLRAASEILDMPPQEIAAATTRNAKRIFGLSL